MTSPKSPDIPALLRRARQDVRFTQTEFASKLGVSRRTLSRWESGVTAPKGFDLTWLVSELHALDPTVAVRVARELGEQPPGASHADLERALWTAADTLGVKAASLRAALGTLVAQWRSRGASLQEIEAFLAGDGSGAKEP